MLFMSKDWRVAYMAILDRYDELLDTCFNPEFSDQDELDMLCDWYEAAEDFELESARVFEYYGLEY